MILLLIPHDAREHWLHCSSCEWHVLAGMLAGAPCTRFSLWMGPPGVVRHPCEEPLLPHHWYTWLCREG